MALEMKVFKDIGAYEPRPMFGLTWRQIAAVAVMVIVGGGIFTLVTAVQMSHGSSMEAATNGAMWLIWPVLVPAAFWGWWRPKGLKPERYLPFAVRDLVTKREVVYGNAADGSTGNSAGPLGAEPEAAARQRQTRLLRKSVSEREEQA